MRVGVLGSGNVGQALGAGFIGRGDEVIVGSRHPDKPELLAWVEKTGGKAGTYKEAAEHAELAVLATPWSGSQEALSLSSSDRLARKVVIDVTNPIEVVADQPPRLALGFDDSAGEQVQRWLPRSQVVKCFNIVNYAYMVHPKFPGGPPDMFLCGNDKSARETVSQICRDFGWMVTDLGGIENSRLMESLAMLWVTVGAKTGNWQHAFKLLRAEG
jgi:8-hydroxy-5-deazaflavin:NADPH oxidoreductase